jgi:hypothetical protein
MRTQKRKKDYNASGSNHELVATPKDGLVVLAALSCRHLLQVVPGWKGRTLRTKNDASNLQLKEKHNHGISFLTLGIIQEENVRELRNYMYHFSSLLSLFHFKKSNDTQQQTQCACLWLLIKVMKEFGYHFMSAKFKKFKIRSSE